MNILAGRVRLIHKIWLRENIFTHHKVVSVVNGWSAFGASLGEKALIRKAVMRQVIILWQATVRNAVLGDVFLT